jgi:uncharacterized protein YkwD
VPRPFRTCAGDVRARPPPPRLVSLVYAGPVARQGVTVVVLRWAACVSLFASLVTSRSQAQEIPCRPEDGLAGVAAELLLNAGAPTPPQLSAAVRAAGSDLVAVRALFLPQDDPARVVDWLVGLAAKSDAPLVCGDARSAEGRLILASPRAGTLELRSGNLHGSLAPGFGRPELVLQSDRGELSRVAASALLARDGLPLDPALRISRVQLVARGPAGPRPVAELTLTQAPVPSARLQVRAEGPLDETGVLQVVAQLREQHGRLALREHRLARLLARAHAREVCAQGRVAHTLAPGADPETRVARAGLLARLVGETVARAHDTGAALDALWDSPSHRLTLLEPRFTHIGVGEATDPEQRTCLVVLLLAWPRYTGR